MFRNKERRGTAFGGAPNCAAAKCPPHQTVRQPSLKLGVYFLGLNLIQSAVGLIISRFKVGTCFPLSFPTCYRNGGGVRPRPAGASAVVEEGSQGWMHATMAAGQSFWLEGGLGGNAWRQDIWATQVDRRACLCARAPQSSVFTTPPNHFATFA